MSTEWIVTSDEIKIIADAVFWLCVLFMSPVIYKATYYLVSPIWVMLFPTKNVELQYTLNGKTYTAIVDIKSNLSVASANLRLIAEQKDRNSEQ